MTWDDFQSLIGISIFVFGLFGLGFIAGWLTK